MILGSSSKSRRKLVEHLVGWEFESPDIDEKSIRCDDPLELPLLIAKEKARAIINRIPKQNKLLVTGDQIVLFEGKVYEKPIDSEQAREFLQSYSNKCVQTVSALVVTDLMTDKSVSNVDVATLQFGTITPGDIEDAILKGDCFLNAGGLDSDLYTITDGEVSSVMGMNMEIMFKMVNEVNEVSMDIFEYDTYVFDFDGVVVDSERFHWLSYQKCDDTLTYEYYCKMNHSITGPYLRDILDSNKKDLYYREYIQEVPLKKGFEEFYNKLLKLGKNVYIVTNTSQEIFDLYAERFPFLKTIHVITDCKKPDSNGYMKVPHGGDHTRIIAFEDSHRGFYAASNVVFTVVLVNTLDYFYYDTIHALNVIEDFTKLGSIQYSNLVCNPFYISSKTYHKNKWVDIKNSGFNITSTWIMDDTSKELLTTKQKEMLCHGFVQDIQRCDFGIFYSEYGDSEMIGSLIEFGIMTAFEKPIYIMGTNRFENEVFSHIGSNVDFTTYANRYSVESNILRIYIKNSLEYKTFCQTTPSKTLVENNETHVVDYVAIVASGEGSRLMPITRNIPKLLVSYLDKSILGHSIDYWKTFTKKFIIVIQTKYNRMVTYYMNLTGVDYEIINVNTTKGQENSFTINSAFKNPKFENKRILFTWCDIYPDSVIPSQVFERDQNVIFTYKNYGRYDATSCNKLVKKAYGNVIGIYYFPHFKNIETFESHMDICDCYKTNFGDFSVYEIDSLIDIGDMNKLDTLVKNINGYKTRYFNSITDGDSGETLVKKSTCPHGDMIIRDEMRFYKYYSNVKCLPGIVKFGKDFYEMEKIQSGVTIHEYNKSLSHDEQVALISDILTFLSEFHSLEKIPVSKNQLYTDVDLEFRKKLDIRLDNVAPILDEFNFIKLVNNIPIVHSIKHIKEDLYNKIQTFFMNKTEYQSIHGDPHMSNIIKGPYLIDPRGYFGNTKLFGPSEYDIGKIMYSLSGFDYFNSDEKFIFYIEGNNITLDINNNIDLFVHLFKDSKVLIYMTILHWLGLSDYTRLNIHKCVSAYYYGIYLYHVYI